VGAEETKTAKKSDKPRTHFELDAGAAGGVLGILQVPWQMSFLTRS